MDLFLLVMYVACWIHRLRGQSLLVSHIFVRKHYDFTFVSDKVQRKVVCDFAVVTKLLIHSIVTNDLQMIYKYLVVILEDKLPTLDLFLFPLLLELYLAFSLESHKWDVL